MFGVLAKILLSPIVIFIIGYIYFGDMRRAVLISLIFYSALSLIALIRNSFQIVTSMAAFNIFKFVSKSLKVFSLLFIMLTYWLAYIIMWGTNFHL